MKCITRRLFYLLTVGHAYLLCCFNLVLAEEIDIGILASSGGQRSFYTSFAEQYERDNPGQKVHFIFMSDAEFKQALAEWFAQGKGPDVLNWQGGERLFQYVRKGYIADISDVWQEENLEAHFTSGAFGTVTLDGAQFGVPISYYQWGFYYRHSLFEKLALSPPETWDEFLRVCQVLSENGVVPITIGAKYKWPTLAWFDYLNLRLNGLSFHQRLLKGEESFQDERVYRVLEHWKSLLDKNYFVTQYYKWKWSDAMPFLYHKMSGMTLMGNFFAGDMPARIKSDFRFFRFPVLNSAVPLYEEAPTDIFMIPQYSENKAAAKRFLKVIAKAKFQQDFNQMLGAISPNTNSKSNEDYFIQQGKLILGEAQGVSQFFDRDTNNDMAQAAMDVFFDFLADKDIEGAQYKLEQARQSFLL
ncbi:ABC transporter substrate-binding protein [Agaribacter flavus]|uniref:ABC transporter substrate-binding protein n=1 Tax=Agaribacter flavus TaxID=1902781 RepID=A0ABV7FUZ5_9ALTE